MSYRLYYLDGHVVEGPRPAADRGTRLHTACEKYLKDEIPLEKLSIDFRNVRGHLTIMKDLKAKAEEVWLCDDHWNYQTEEDLLTRFKAVIDIHYIIGKTLFIIDLKTGRQYPEHADQLQLYAVMGFSRYPEVAVVETSALYLEGPGHPSQYPRAMLPHLQKFWANRGGILFDATEYPATPSADACRYCDYRAAKGGQCPVS
jgi:hypothetical protein